jgi:hypothetical protein
MTQFLIEPRAPFRLDLTAWALRRRTHNAIDRWNGFRYERVLSVDGDGPYALSVTQDKAMLAVSLDGMPVGDSAEQLARAALERMLGLRADLAPFAAMAEHDPWLGPLAHRMRGLKPPRFPTVFEALVNGIACQQLSLVVGIHLLNRLTAAPLSPRTPTAPAHSQTPTSSPIFSPSRSSLTVSARPRPVRSSTWPVRSSRATSISMPWVDSTIARQWSASCACAASVAGPPST